MQHTDNYHDRLSAYYQHARANGYAIPAFNFNDMWQLLAIQRAAQQEKAPVLAAATGSVIKAIGMGITAAMGRWGMEDQPGFFLHLDHSKKVEECQAAVDAGFASVMIDGSALPLEENIAMTRAVVAYAHPRGVFVEGELGRLGGREEDVSGGAALVQIEDVQRYVNETGVDSLAVAIGNAHGFYKAAPVLDFKRLEEVGQVVSIPLVLHGGTGIPEDQLRQAIRLGMNKVNVGTLLHHAYLQGLRTALNEAPDSYDVKAAFGQAIQPVIAVVCQSIHRVGANGRLEGLLALP
ncbi:MAG: class II fructose-bisphosphate aldolase [Chloroflexi bacterium]|nr:class II fructose-bisphosphate aldolase [Anaerolineaceae bacterium]NMB87610.1 class II fructose-bisphosphate aldolase [Chloroflexota bacterium]